MDRSSSVSPSELLAPAEIQAKVAELGSRMTSELAGKEPVFICVLRGAAIFHADLVRAVDLTLTVDFISVSSYGAATRSSGQVRLTKDLDSSIRERDVVLVEDIVDTGLTLRYLLDNLASRNPASLRVCSLLSKPARRKVDVSIDYQGFEIPDKFVVGYGLDFNQRYRNLNYIGVLSVQE